jgi:hypothetical protein
MHRAGCALVRQTQLTFAEALATWGAINLGSSVLGAVGTVWKTDELVNPRLVDRDPVASPISRGPNWAATTTPRSQTPRGERNVDPVS